MTQEKDDTLGKILVIQGNSSTGPMLQKVLEKAGHEVVLARPESASLPSSTESSPSLVITDFMAASSDDRLDTLRHVHQVAPQAKIIALFSGDEVNQAEQQVVAMQPGVFRVLNNPFELGGLLEAMQKAIKIPR